MKYYYWLRLWFWWNYVIKKDKDSNELTEVSIWSKYDTSVKDTEDIAYRQQNIAFKLNNGISIKQIYIRDIKNSKI